MSNITINQTSNDNSAVNSLLWQRLINHKAESCGIATKGLDISEICDKIALHERSQIQIAMPNGGASLNTPYNNFTHKMRGILPMAIEYGFIDYSKPIDLKRPMDWAQLTKDVNNFDYYAKESGRLLEPIDWRLFKGDVNGLIKAVTAAWEKDELIEDGLKLGVKVELFEHDLKVLKMAVELAEEFAQVAKEAQNYSNIDPDDYYDYDGGSWDTAGLLQAIEDEKSIERYQARCMYDAYYQSVRL